MRCGQKVWSDTRKEHLQTCSYCSDPSLKYQAHRTGQEMRCGARIPKLGVADHRRSCERCIEIKKANIAERMRKHNSRPEQRAAASAAAKKTSQRRDLQLERAGRMLAWQKDHPAEAAANLEKGRRSVKKSRSEEWMATHLVGWKRHVKISCETIRKEIDFQSPDERVWVEVDGYWHFFGHKSRDPRPSRQVDRLAGVRDRDSALNAEARRRGDVMLIRMAASCFVSSSGRIKDDWLEWLTATLLSPTPGVYCAGELYESAPWAREGCTILRSPTPSTTSSSPTGS